jgi:hypothetical protein
MYYSEPKTNCTVLAEKTISGVIIDGTTKTYTVKAIEVHDAGTEGRFVVCINGRINRWYAMERPAMLCVKKALVGYYGFSYGEPF